MKARTWSLVDPSTPLAQVIPATFLFFTEKTSKIIPLRWARNGTVGTGEVFRTVPELTKERTVGELAEGILGDGTRVMAVPTVSVTRSGTILLITELCFGFAAFATAVALQSLLALFLGVSLALLAGLLLTTFLAERVSRFQSFNGEQARQLGVTPRNVHRYALTAARGELWRGALPAGSPVSPALQVDRIRREYGALRTDLVYRIECSALFDPTAPTTAAFEAALAAFDELPPGPRQADQANRVEVAFNVARQHGERVALRHVAEAQRDDLRRAAKAARVAANASTPGERAAALASLRRILNDPGVPVVISPDELRDHG